eukprot:COSAG05_NODE_883_length_6777_cov_36.660081_1_plen_90_part_00
MRIGVCLRAAVDVYVSGDQERDAFQKGEKLVAILSEACSTGTPPICIHACTLRQQASTAAVNRSHTYILNLTAVLSMIQRAHMCMCAFF